MPISMSETVVGITIRIKKCREARACIIGPRLIKFAPTKPRADFDIFSQMGWRVSQGGWKFFRRCGAPRSRQAIANCRTFLKFIFDLYRYIFCKGN